MAKSSNSEFLKEFDRFGQPVGLTYKNNPSYNTPIGGVFTMIAFFIFMTWLALETIDVYMPPGKHSVGTQEVLTQKLNGSWPLTELEMSNFFVSYELRLGPTNVTVAPGTEDQYFSGLWLQYKDGKFLRSYKPKKCQDMFEKDDISQMFW